MGDTFSGPGVTLSPLRALAWGLLVVIVDVRVGGLDLVPDPVGWLVAVLSLGRLGGLHDGFRVAAVASGVGLLLSLPDWVGVTAPALALLVSAVETVVVFATCTSVMRLLPGRRGGANTLRWWDLGLTIVGTVLVAASLQDPAWGGLVIALVVAQLVVLVCFLVLLFRAAKDPVPGSEKTLQKHP